MSNIALSWAFRCHVGNASAKAVLVYLADRASDDGTAAFPKIETIVNVTELSERTVRSSLKLLQERGFIRRGDQRYAASRQRRQDPSASILPDRVGPRGRIRSGHAHVDQGDARRGTGHLDHERDRGPGGRNRAGKR